MKIPIILFCLLFIFSAQPAAAQLDIAAMTNPELSIDLEPAYPQPGEQVTATINDYRGGTYGSGITWVFNGQVIPDAENRRSAIVTAGAAGGTQTIEAVLSKPQGGKEVLSTTIRPLYLDIIIEPQTRVPNFYLGRSIPSIGSIVNATAVVSEVNILNPDLVYTWKINQTVLESGAVRGRNQVSFTTPMGSNAILSLQVTTPTGEVLGRRAIFIPSVSPDIKFYEVNALLGMSARPVAEAVPIIGNSITVKAEPFYLDTRTYNNPPIAQWEIDGQKTSNSGGNPYEITLQRVNASGFAELNFHVRDTSQVLQGVEDSIQINF